MTETISSGRQAEISDIVRYLKKRSDDYHPTVRLAIRDLVDELVHGRHRRGRKLQR
jgi:hypothetical protein